MPHTEPRTNRDEDLIAAIALGKTVAFIIYSFLLMVLLFGLSFFLTLGGPLSDWGTWALFVVWAGAEALLIYLIAEERLPGTTSQRAEPIADWQLALGLLVVSATAVFWPYSNPDARVIVVQVANGAIAVAGAVYLITKSVISRRVRWGVLPVLLVPILFLYLYGRG